MKLKERYFKANKPNQMNQRFLVKIFSCNLATMKEREIKMTLYYKIRIAQMEIIYTDYLSSPRENVLN